MRVAMRIFMPDEDEPASVTLIQADQIEIPVWGIRTITIKEYTGRIVQYVPLDAGDELKDLLEKKGYEDEPSP